MFTLFFSTVVWISGTIIETQRFSLTIPTDMKDRDGYYEVIFNAFSRLKENKAVFQTLLHAHLESVYLDYMNEKMTEKFAENGYKGFAYGPHYAVGSLFNVSIQWVKSGCKESVKYMTDHYLKMVFGSQKP